MCFLRRWGRKALRRRKIDCKYGVFTGRGLHCGETGPQYGRLCVLVWCCLLPESSLNFETDGPVGRPNSAGHLRGYLKE